MKKLLSLLLALTLSFTMLLGVGCSEPKDVVVKYYANGADIVKMMNSGAETIGLIPEPAATNLEKAFAKQGKEIYRLDLQELYDGEAKAYPQAVLMAKKSVLTADLYNGLNSSINESVAWAKENPSNAVSAINGKFATTLNASTLSASAIEGCKIYFESADLAKDSVKKYVEDIRSIEQTSANQVNDEFFFNKTQPVTSIEKESLTFACPDGAPAIAISKLINDNSQLGTGKVIDYKVVASTLIGAQMSQGTADIILMPVNAATKLYNKYDSNDPYVCVAVITHGNFYIMSTEQISIDDLKGKNIAVPNMGAVPDWTIRYVLQQNGYNVSVSE